MGTMLPVLRRSAIQTAKSCLYRYDQIWNRSVSDDNEYSLRGIGFHACAHRYIELLAEAGLPSDEDLSKRAFVAGIASAMTPAELIPEVATIYKRWAELFQLDNAAYLGAEEKQHSDADHVFTPDLLYARPDGFEIVDFKTFYVPMTQAQLREDWQARWYSFAARRVWKGFPKYTFTHSYVRLGTTTAVTFEAQELDGFEEEVASIAAVIQKASETNDWPATPGTECNYCTLKCPVADEVAVIPKRLVATREAQELGARILAGETWLKQAKKLLKGYCATEGHVDVGGVQFDNRPVDQRSYPIKDVLQVLQDRGRMGAFDSEDLTLSHSALSKLFKQYPQLEEDLLPFLREKRTYRFAAKRPGVGDNDDE